MKDGSPHQIPMRACVSSAAPAKLWSGTWVVVKIMVPFWIHIVLNCKPFGPICSLQEWTRREVNKAAQELHGDPKP